MTLQEAIKSGKPYKRANWEEYKTPAENQLFIHHLSEESILANDWEILDKPDLTEAQKHSIKNVMDETLLQVLNSPGHYSAHQIVELIKEKL